MFSSPDGASRKHRDARAVPGMWCEGLGSNRGTGLDPRIAPDPAIDLPAREYQVGPEQPWAPLQPVAHRVGEVPRRVGHDAVRLAGQPHLPQIPAYDCHLLPVAEAKLEFGGPARMKLHRDHPCTGAYQSGRQCPGTGAEIDDQI